MKTDIEKIFSSTLLNPEQRQDIEKLVAKGGELSNAVKKLLTIHDAVLQSALSDPLKSTIRYLKSVENSMQKAQEYIEEDTEDTVVIGKEYSVEADAVVDMTELRHRSIAVLIDKQNGVPERMANMQKIITGAGEDVIKMIHLHNTHASESLKEDVKDMENLSWVDRQAEAQRKGAKKAARK